MWFQADGLEVDAVRAGQDPDRIVCRYLCKNLGVNEADITRCIIKSKSIAKISQIVANSLMIDFILIGRKCIGDTSCRS